MPAEWTLSPDDGTLSPARPPRASGRAGSTGPGRRCMTLGDLDHRGGRDFSSLPLFARRKLPDRAEHRFWIGAAFCKEPLDVRALRYHSPVLDEILRLNRICVLAPGGNRMSGVPESQRLRSLAQGG